MRAVARVLITAVVYILALLLTAATAFYAVLVLGGVHAGLVPRWLEPVILVLGWIVVLALPLVVAVKAWRRLGRADTPLPDRVTGP